MPCNIWNILILKFKSLFLWNSNLTGWSAFFVVIFVLFCFFFWIGKPSDRWMEKVIVTRSSNTWAQCPDSPPLCEVKPLTYPPGASVPFSMKLGRDLPKLPCRLIWDLDDKIQQQQQQQQTHGAYYVPGTILSALQDEFSQSLQLFEVFTIIIPI